jgi:hypothetical protein
MTRGFFITKNGFWTLMDIIIVDPTHIDMMQQAMNMVVQEKT